MHALEATSLVRPTCVRHEDKQPLASSGKDVRFTSECAFSALVEWELTRSVRKHEWEFFFPIDYELRGVVDDTKRIVNDPQLAESRSQASVP